MPYARKRRYSRITAARATGAFRAKRRQSAYYRRKKRYSAYVKKYPWRNDPDARAFAFDRY